MIHNERDEEFSILLVESDSQELVWLRKNLQKDPHFSQIDCVASVDEALARIQKKTYHVLLVESQIEQGSGLRLLEKMRSQHIRLPFVLLTSVWDDRLAREAIQAGVSELIVKSEKEFNDLSAKLRACYEKFYDGDAPRFEAEISKRFVFPDEERAFSSAESLGGTKDLGDGSSGIKDALTGLFNHSYLHERIVTEISKAVRYRYPISCLMLDIDHFKLINEEFGYSIGDQLLKECAAILLKHCRMSDIVARYGGEEFAVILPHIDYLGSLDLARRLRLVFAKHHFMIRSREVGVTISVGISSFPEDRMKRRGELLVFASNALAYSKVSGRNRVTMYREIERTAIEGMPEIKISEDRITEFQRRMSDSAEAARRSYIEASTTLIMALESKDPFTAGHAARCAKYAKEVADVMGLSTDDAEIIQQEYNLQPSDFIDLKALAGDPSDNIPGVPGIGPKTATQLLQDFDTLKKLYEAIEKLQGTRNNNQTNFNNQIQNIKPRILNLLIEYKEQAFLSQSLATIHKDVPIDFDLDKAKFGDYDKDRLRELFEELGFQSLLRRFGGNEAADDSDVPRNQKDLSEKTKKDQQLKLL